MIQRHKRLLAVSKGLASWFTLLAINLTNFRIMNVSGWGVVWRPMIFASL